MRYLLTPVVLVALLFAAPAYAETIIMECRKASEVDPTHYKYESPLIGKAKMFARVDGQWTKVAGTIADRGAVFERTDDSVADGDHTGDKLKKGDEFQRHYKWVYDFAFFKYTRTYYSAKMDGSPLVPGKEGRDRAKPEIEEMLCKKPDESWRDRYG